MRTQLPLNAGQNAISGLLFLFFLLFSLSVSGQQIQTFTTQAPGGDWDNPNTWVGGEVPSNEIQNTTVRILHNVQYTGNSNITLRNKGTLIVDRATFDNNSNLNVRKGGELQATFGQVFIGPGILNNDGTVRLTNSIMTKDGNVINNGFIELTNSCFTLTSGNFNWQKRPLRLGCKFC